MRTIIVAVPFVFIAVVLCWLAARVAAAERKRRDGLRTRIAELRSRSRVVRNRLAGASLRRVPDSLRSLFATGGEDAARTARAAEKAVADAERYLAVRPESSRILLEQAAGLLDAAESMLEMSDVSIPAMVAEQRRYARQILEQNRAYRVELQEFIAASACRGLRFDEESRRVAMAENAIKAEENALAADPLASMRRMRTLACRLSGIAAYVYFHRAVFDHVMENVRALGDRIRDAEILGRSMDAMLADLRERGYRADPDPEDRGGTVAELCASVRSAIEDAKAFCTAKDRRLGSAIVKIAVAESDASEIERRLLAVMEEWSLRVGRLERH